MAEEKSKVTIIRPNRLAPFPPPLGSQAFGILNILKLRTSVSYSSPTLDGLGHKWAFKNDFPFYHINILFPSIPTHVLLFICMDL